MSIIITGNLKYDSIGSWSLPFLIYFGLRPFMCWILFPFKIISFIWNEVNKIIGKVKSYNYPNFGMSVMAHARLEPTMLRDCECIKIPRKTDVIILKFEQYGFTVG